MIEWLGQHNNHNPFSIKILLKKIAVILDREETDIEARLKNVV